jgi:two-component system chemotaxis response regulator CheV
VTSVSSLHFDHEDEKDDGRATGELRQVVVFSLGEEVFAAPVEIVREILRWQGVRPVPHAHHSLLGVSTIRGEVIPVIDLAAFLEIEGAVPTDQKKLIVLEFATGQKVGLAVDGVRRIYNIPLDQMDYTLKGTFLGDYLECVIKQEEENILLPDFEKIVAAFRLENLRLSRERAEEVRIDAEDE